MIAGQDAEATRIDGQAGVDAELGAEIGDATRQRRALEVPRLALARLGDQLGDIRGIQSVERVVRERRERRIRVTLIVGQPREEGLRRRVPRPVIIVNKSA